MADEVSRATRVVLALSLIGTLLWISAIFLAPALESRSAGRGAAFLYAVFSPTCHQIPERCFTFQGHPLAVCARCLGIYVGFLAGVVAYPGLRGFSRLRLPSPKAFVLLSVPIGLDAVGGALRLWASPIGARFGTGFLWGTILPFYFITGVAELVVARCARRRLSPAPEPPPLKPVVDNSPRKSIE